jgi:hypothetical protein
LVRGRVLHALRAVWKVVLAGKFGAELGQVFFGAVEPLKASIIVIDVLIDFVSGVLLILLCDIGRGDFSNN